ncbi:aminopeptidase P N-terminal domain-containing protein [soil metagenome]
MKRTIALISLFIFLASALSVLAVDGPLTVRVTPPAPVFTDAERQTELARRRAAVAASMADNSVMVLFSAEPKLYAADVDYVFRQENNLYYLTNLKQAGATLVIKKIGGIVTETVYLPMRVPQRETWNGKMYSNEDAARISGVKNVVSASDREAFLQSLTDKSDTAVKNVYLLLPEDAEDNDGMREFAVEHQFATKLTGHTVENAQHIFAPLRQIKSRYELKLLQHAIDITTEAQMRSWAMASKAKMEYEVQAEVEYTFRRRNADFWGYPSIVGCGANATTLHYEESSGPVTPGQLLLMDVGAEYDHQTADVTRTFPVNGKFTKEQAEIYQIVYDAQEAAAKAAKPGATMAKLSDAANKVIIDGLFRLGLVTNKNSQQYRMWYMHGLGHWLGMNVHDVGDYDLPLRPGMTYTNEPGIYIRPDALDYLPDTPENKAFIAKVKPVFEKYKSIGVRIEDDMLITDTGVSWMTANLPRSIKDIEAFMATNR